MNESRTGVREISIEEFDEMIENHDDLLIVDVRDAAEFERGHIPGALLIPHEILEGATDDANRSRMDELFGAHHKTLVLCSQDGTRSAVLANKLQQMGYTKIYSLAGGIDRWQTQGYALVTK